MPRGVDYGTYQGNYGGFGFLASINEYLDEDIRSKIKCSPFYSILIDESTNRGLEKHLIVYVMYLSEGGIGAPVVDFLNLRLVEDGT